MANTESFYGGASYSMDSKYNSDYGTPLGYGSFSQYGTSLDARTANQIKEVSKHLNTGLKTIEVAGHSPEVFEAIPKEHLKEISRVAKLTGAELTFHAPMIDPTGITQHGWEEMQQKNAEEQLWGAIKRSHDLDPKGNINVTFHASTTQLPPAELKVFENGKEKIKSILLITPDGKQLAQVKEEEKYFPEGEKWEKGKPLLFDPEKAIKQENTKYWDHQLDNLNHYSNYGSDFLERAEAKPRELIQAEGMAEQFKIQNREIPEELTNQINALREAHEEQKKQSPVHAGVYLRNAYNQLKQSFDMIYKGASEQDKGKLDNFAQKIQEANIADLSRSKDFEDLKKFSGLIENGLDTLQGIKNPNILIPLKDFAVEKSAETTANIALKGYKKFGDSAPIISLENHPAQQSLLTTGEDLKAVIEKSRKLFVEKAKKEGLSESEAKEQAEKLIGATWDVGHINMLRRYGYGEKELIKQTEKVAPYVKKVHLSDNFGFEHTELPMGMGNVPIKEMMEKLGKEGFQGKKITEALSWWQHFSEQGKFHAITPTMRGMGVPIYSGGGPMWNQYLGAMGGYFSGYGILNPEVHHSLYGAGFTNLPSELGGQISGKESRLSGTPMD